MIVPTINVVAFLYSSTLIVGTIGFGHGIGYIIKLIEDNNLAEEISQNELIPNDRKFQGYGAKDPFKWLKHRSQSSIKISYLFFI